MTILECLYKFMLTEIDVDLVKESQGPDEDLLERGIIDSFRIPDEMPNCISSGSQNIENPF